MEFHDPAVLKKVTELQREIMVYAFSRMSRTDWKPTEYNYIIMFALCECISKYAVGMAQLGEVDLKTMKTMVLDNISNLMDSCTIK